MTDSHGRSRPIRGGGEGTRADESRTNGLGEGLPESIRGPASDLAVARRLFAEVARARGVNAGRDARVDALRKRVDAQLPAARARDARFGYERACTIANSNIHRRIWRRALHTRVRTASCKRACASRTVGKSHSDRASAVRSRDRRPLEGTLIVRRQVTEPAVADAVESLGQGFDHEGRGAARTRCGEPVGVAPHIGELESSPSEPRIASPLARRRK
jgi:hypothetical protein